MRNTRFRTKVLTVTVLPVIITALILASILISGRINEFNTQTIEKGNNIARYIALMSEYGIFSDDFIYLESTLTHTLNQPDIIAIQIKNSSGTTVLKKYSTNTQAYKFETDNNKSRKIFTSSIFKTTVEINDLQDEANENFSGSKTIGTVNIVMDLNYADIIKKQIINDGVFITSALTLITIFIALLFSRSVTTPLTLINKGVNIIKQGDLQHRIDITFSGELAELAKGINYMTSSLEIAHEREKQLADDVLFFEKTKAQITLEAIGDCVITTDTKGNITYINPAAARLTGYSNQYAKNKPLSEIFQIRNDNSDVFINYPIMECINNSEVIHHESGYILKSIDGNEFTIRETASPILDKTNKVVGAVLVFHDFSNLQKMSDILAYQASHDDLTGLLNRRAFESKMHEILKDITPHDTHTLCYIDLDRFKIINDTCGHLAGDRLLKIISTEITKNIRQHDLFARLGGDEFGIIFFNCDIDKSIMLAENIKSIVSNIKFSWDTHAFNIGASIGIVPLTSGQNMTDLMMTVDTACYVAKDKGRNRIHVYQKNDEDILQRECDLQWFQEIYKALEEDNFLLYAQKITPCTNKDVHDIYEILIRLKLNNKIILPYEFISAAERYSIMPKIDMWVIKTLFKTIKTDTNLENNTYFSVNLSGQTLTDNTFIDFLNKELDKSLISPEKIIFEITETAAIRNLTEATNFIRIFKDRGCKFALDDFGSGMSSFKYLSQLAIDFIKIDGDFIKDLNTNSFNQNVVKSISQIGHSLGLSVIAEYVETKEILAAIDKSLIDFVQGYAIEHPHPLIEHSKS